MPTISSSRVQPLATPSTALLTSARASPCTADCESFSRIATRCPSCCSMRMPRGNCVSSLPFGPCTATVLPSIFTVTPLGSAIGFLPILDISYQLSACKREYPLSGVGRVSHCEYAPACLRPDRSTSSFASPPPSVCSGMIAREPAAALLVWRGRPRPRSLCLLPYQDDFETPGISPRSANPRKHRRQMPNFRRYPRGLPHSLQRLCRRVENLGFWFLLRASSNLFWIFASLTRFAVVAT